MTEVSRKKAVDEGELEKFLSQFEHHFTRTDSACVIAEALCRAFELYHQDK